jgi:hypothetical protein
VFARGVPQIFGLPVESEPAADVIEFLWASRALFDEPDEQETATA